jgi:hypothetical protein
MRITIRNISIPGIIITLVLLLSSVNRLTAQNIRFGLFADPAVTWFASDTKETVNDGARTGFGFGLPFNGYFADKYSFSSGISIQNIGGRLYSTDSVTMSFNNLNVDVMPNEPVVYKIQYISVPVGLKFESNQIGYLTFFTDVGIDSKFMIGGKADIPSEEISGETAKNELSPFNMSYHLMGGVEYSLGGNTEMVFGLGFEHCFLDATRDINLQPADKISSNIIKLRIGINF